MRIVSNLCNSTERNKRKCIESLTEMIFCREPICSTDLLGICFNVLLCASFLLKFCYQVYSEKNWPRTIFRVSSLFQIISIALNCCFGLVCFSLGLWNLEERLKEGLKHLPLLWCLVLLTKGFTWFLIGFMLSIRRTAFGRKFIRTWSVIMTLFVGNLCVPSALDAVEERNISMKAVLDTFSFLGAILLLICVFKHSEEEDSSILHGSPYRPLNGESDTEDEPVASISNAGFFSRMSFWWLNSLLKEGYKKPLEEKDIPPLDEEDKAENCYSLFLEQLNKQNDTNHMGSPSILRAIISCHQKEILVSGVFALLKVLSLSAGPMLLNAFINVSSGKEAFRYEGFLLALGLFAAKFLESLSQRQWYFRTKRIGMQLRSLLSAAIFHKQLRLPNSAKHVHSSGEIVNYLTVDSYRIGEFSFWFHQMWSMILQLCIAVMILYNSVGFAAIPAMVVIILTVASNTPLAKLQDKFQTKLMAAQDERLKATSEALTNMKVLKLYAWETHFRKVLEGLRKIEFKWLFASQLRKAYANFLLLSSPVLVSATTFYTCYILGVPLYAGNVFTFVATLRLVQEPIRQIPEVIGVVIQAKVSFTRIAKFLDTPELQNSHSMEEHSPDLGHPIVIKSASFCWHENSVEPTLRNINLEVCTGEKVALCGEVGSGKSTLLAAILGELPCSEGMIQVHGKLAYVSQNAWIQTGTIQENILFGSPMDKQRYKKTLEKCCLVKDIEMLPFGDLTEIGERGVNLSGGQKQRVQLARALYQDADIYLLDDPFSAVDAHTLNCLFNDYVLGALSKKTVLLVTHHLDFLPVMRSILLMKDGKVLLVASYNELMSSSKEFHDLVTAHKEAAGFERYHQIFSQEKDIDIHNTCANKKLNLVKASGVDQFIKKEERKTGDGGLKPYLQYLNQNKGLLYASLAALSHVIFVAGQILQNSWLASNVQNPQVSTSRLISVYLAVGFSAGIFLLFRSIFIVVLGLQSSKSLFSCLLNSLFHAPMSFFDSTPLGRILSRASYDLSIVDLDVPFSLTYTFCAILNAFSNLGVVAGVTWQVLFIATPIVYITVRLQRYHLASAKELVRINGTTRSLVTNHLAESISGVKTIRAFKEQDRFFAKMLMLIDKNASTFFQYFAANEWLIQRVEIMGIAILSSSALVMALLPPGTFSSGFVGMALSYGLSLNTSFIVSVHYLCTLANHIISVERLNQYMHLSSEACEIIERNIPPPNWPLLGRIELQNLQIRYREDTPLVLKGISCVFKEGQKIGIVGRTGSGKSTLVGALFRLVEPVGGKIVIDGLDIMTIGLYDLRSHLGIIPQDPILFRGSVRYNIDPLGQYSDHKIWEILGKCQLREAILAKENGLDSLVVEDGSNWSMGQKQLFCLGRMLLRRSRILVFDEATASIDHATDAILQKIIRTEVADCTVITVTHRIPTVMDCAMVLSISEGKLVEYDEPEKLIRTEGSLFGELVKEYWSHTAEQGMRWTRSHQIG